MVIDKFDGKYYWLSNFAASPITYNGEEYPTVENAYQAAKIKDAGLRRVFSRLTPNSAKKSARHMHDYYQTTPLVQTNEDWQVNKFGIMEELLRIKFTQHTDLKDKLLKTGDAELIEGNTWGDVTWGVCDGVGENHLGKMLMKIREEIRPI